ncbi:hypothetical protein [Streptomyces sp. NPDC049040]|uniref:hypothetical protein n=1 Tax=Streptomyces sp. NPDC049040 TaxID=3365593 RepID=UPI00371EB844
MTDQEQYDHFRFQGARILLRPLRFTAVPQDAAARNALLEPAIRALWDVSGRGGRSLYEVAAQLRAAADLAESGQDIDLKEIPGQPEVLREIAEHVAAWSVGVAGRLDGALPTSDELAFRFPLLTDMLLVHYGQDGLAWEDDTLSPREGLLAVVDDYHPTCLWWLPHLAAECQEALGVFQTEEALRQFFKTEQRGGTPGLPWLEWLPLIIDVFGEHMRAHHPPRWVHRTH